MEIIHGGEGGALALVRSFVACEAVPEVVALREKGELLDVAALTSHLKGNRRLVQVVTYLRPSIGLRGPNLERLRALGGLLLALSDP